MTSSNPQSGVSADDTANEAFVSEFMQHRHRIYAFIAKQLVNHADVEDIFQRTSIVLWRKMAQFKPESSFFHWACGVAHNEVRNFLTTKRRDRLHFDAELVALLAEEARNEDGLSEARLNALRACIPKLSDEQQRILRRCYAGATSITDIAGSLGVNRDALYKQVARLREKLLHCIRFRLRREGVVR